MSDRIRNVEFGARQGLLGAGRRGRGEGVCTLYHLLDVFLRPWVIIERLTGNVRGEEDDATVPSWYASATSCTKS